MVREDAKNAFYRTRHLQVFLVFQRPDGPRLRADGPRLVLYGARFSFERSIVLTMVKESGVQFIWQTGKYYNAAIMEQLKGQELPMLKVTDFISDMGAAYKIGRAHV